MKSSFSKFLLATSLFLLTTGFSFRCSSTQLSQLPTVNLEYWRVFDDQDTMADTITQFEKLHPNVVINYKKFRYDEYEQQLLNAFAEDRAPDIFSIPNTWIGHYTDRILPEPAQITLPTQQVQGTLKPETVIINQTTPGITPREVQEQYPDVVFQDVVQNRSRVLALPVALDTMALYYNRDLLNQAGITAPPKTWKEVQDMAPKLTKRDDKGNIIQSAIALGGSANVPRAFDIVSLLMMQNGTQMTDDQGMPIFDKIPPHSSMDQLPGPQALQYYTDFANPGKTTYSWNSSLPNALDMFTQGRLAMMLGYSYHLDILKANAAQINWDVAPVPQVDPNNRLEYANYWVETASRKTAHPNEAWGFIRYATDAANVGGYLRATSKPPALRSLLPQATGQPLPHPYDIFADAVLTARSWYQGQQPLVAEDIFNSMIDAVTQGDLSVNKAVAQASSQVFETMTEKKP